MVSWKHAAVNGTRPFSLRPFTARMVSIGCNVVLYRCFRSMLANSTMSSFPTVSVIVRWSGLFVVLCSSSSTVETMPM